MNTDFTSSLNDFPSTDFTPDLISTKIHIRIQQRTAKKYITTVAGLPEQQEGQALDFDRILAQLKVECSCNGSLKKENEKKENNKKESRNICGTCPPKPIEKEKVLYIQLQGDQRQLVRQFLIREGLAKEQDIIMHGF